MSGLGGGDWSRRDFGRAVVGAAGCLALGMDDAAFARADDRAGSLLGRFWRSLDADRRRSIARAADDPRRSMVGNHWAVVPGAIADLTAAQRELALDLIREVCTEAGFARLTRQRDDDAAGWKHDHLAVFGTPDGTGPFEWIVSGRHLTLRGGWDGAIPSGPLFWGHTAIGAANLARDQVDAAAALFDGLTGDERRRAILTPTAGRGPGAGLVLGSIGSDGRDAARRLLATLIAPFRDFADPAVRAGVDPAGSLGEVRWQAFRIGDAPADRPPTAWRLVGPGFAWSLHAEPHVHSWFEPA